MDKSAIQLRFWRRVYDWFAPLYDGVDWFTGNTAHRLRRRALEYLPPPGSRLLEIGFGSGKLHVELARRCAMAGLDQAHGMVRLTRRRLAAAGLASDLACGSVYAIPWRDAAFDAVLSTFAFSAFPDAVAALDEMIRVVKAGGRIVIVDAGPAMDGNPVAAWLARLWDLLGDTMRDEVPLMESVGLQEVTRQDYGPCGSVHVVVGVRPEIIMAIDSKPKP
jgi:ubiquinone/menaquinone biosynthesis C-methylase UbiE